MSDQKAQIAIIGLGRMGKGIAKRLLQAGVPIVVWNRSPEPREELAKLGAQTVDDYADVIAKLQSPKVIWSMLPQGAVTENILLDSNGFFHHLQPGDIMIDGGNANYQDSVRRGQTFAAKGVHYLDIGTSGGLVGESKGYCLMIGGPREAYDTVAHLFDHIAQPQGYGYIGPSGSGHFVKMVHNAIEYGMMQAYGEGLDLVKNGAYPDVDLEKLVTIWNHGSIIDSFLGKIIQEELHADPILQGYTGEIGYTGEAQWAIKAAEQYKIDFDIIGRSLAIRHESPQTKSFGNKVVAALRHGFGGHTNRERQS